MTTLHARSLFSHVLFRKTAYPLLRDHAFRAMMGVALSAACAYAKLCASRRPSATMPNVGGTGLGPKAIRRAELRPALVRTCDRLGVRVRQEVRCRIAGDGRRGQCNILDVATGRTETEVVRSSDGVGARQGDSPPTKKSCDAALVVPPSNADLQSALSIEGREN